MAKENYYQLEKEFSLLRRPYITLAQAIKKIEMDCKNSDSIKDDVDKIESFDFYLFNIKPHFKEEDKKFIFRWLPGYDEKKFENITNEVTKERNIFQNNINNIVKSKIELDDLTEFYKNIIEHGKDASIKMLTYLLAVYHITYWVNVPAKCKDTNKPLFLSGIVHFLHTNKTDINSDSEVLNYKCQLSELKDTTAYSLYLVDYGQEPKAQVTDEFAKINEYKSFFINWINSILEDIQKKVKYPFLIYFPIYDSLLINRGVLRGYLGINCKTDSTRSMVKQYFDIETFRQIQFEINNAFIKGAHNDILDRYMSLKDPIEHWIKNLFHLHNWYEIKPDATPTKDNDDIWWIEDSSCILNIEKILDRATVIEKPTLTHKYLRLTFPSKDSDNLSLYINLNPDSPDTYVTNRIWEVISLLDDILVRWQVLKQATKSAISAVISRNMSHNIGSHVLSKYGTTESILSLGSGVDEQFKSSHETNEIENEKNKIANLIANNNSYLKSRMDYLADLATSVPTLETNKLFYREVLSNLDKNRILLNHISGIDDFKYSIVLKDCRYTDEKTIEGNSQDDILVSIPNDILGCHALFVIIENIIRNTAKHGNKKDDVCFILEVHESKEDNSLYEVLIYDDIQIKEDLTEEEKKELPEELKESYKKIDWLVFKQNTNINKSVLDPITNKLRQGAWGLIEMDVSAAYLRKIASDEVELDDYELDLFDCDSRKLKKSKNVNILKAIKVKSCLGYRFHIAKPKNYLLVGNYDLTDEKKIKLVNEGILVLSDEQFNPKEEIYSHHFLLYEEINNIRSKIEQNKSSLTPRIVKLDLNLKGQIASFLGNSNSIKEIDALIWPIWTKSLMKNKNINMIKCSGSPDSNNIDVSANKFDFPSAILDIINGETYRALILNHGNKWRDVVDKKGGDGGKTFSYIEPMPSRVKNVQINYDVDNDVLIYSSLHDEIKKARISEFLITKIGVIDERIQEFLEKDYDAENMVKIKYQKIYSNTGIVVPEKNNINLSSMDFAHIGNEGEKSIKEKLEQWFENSLKDMDALIIHLGILEKLLKGSDKSDVGIRKYIIDNITKKNENIIVVITSGRGQPHNLPHSERFVNLSSIIDCLIEGRSKYKLNNLIFSARRLRG